MFLERFLRTKLRATDPAIATYRVGISFQDAISGTSSVGKEFTFHMVLALDLAAPWTGNVSDQKVGGHLEAVKVHIHFEAGFCGE